MGNNKYIERMWGISISDVTGGPYIVMFDAGEYEVIHQGCGL